jgi:hypothetical protein
VTPWAPIGITVLLTLGPALLVWRLTRNGTLALSTGLLVLALASFALGTIATVAFVWGGVLVVAAAIGFIAAWLGRGKSEPHTR